MWSFTPRHRLRDGPGAKLTVKTMMGSVGKTDGGRNWTVNGLPCSRTAQANKLVIERRIDPAMSAEALAEPRFRYSQTPATRCIYRPFADASARHRSACQRQAIRSVSAMPNAAYSVPVAWKPSTSISAPPASTPSGSP